MALEWVKKKLLLRDLTEILEEHPHILQVKNQYHNLAVKFDTGITEHWEINDTNKTRKNTFQLPFNRDYFNDHEIKTHKQFETNPLYPEELKILQKHFLIERKDLELAGWCDVRFKIHDIAIKLSEEGYLPLTYTDKILMEDYEKLLYEDLSKHQTTTTRFSAFGVKPPSGRRLIMHFMPCAAKDKWDFYSIYNLLNKLKGDITRENIVYYLSKNDHTIRYPAFYRAFFRQWVSIGNKKVYDLCPDWGFKALAVLAENGQYYCDSRNLVQLQALASYLGGFVSYPNQDFYDVIILNDIYPVSMEKAEELIGTYSSCAEYLVIVISQDDRQKFIERYQPWRVIRINNCIVEDANSDDYMMVIHQK